MMSVRWRSVKIYFQIWSFIFLIHSFIGKWHNTLETEASKRGYKCYIWRLSLQLFQRYQTCIDSADSSFWHVHVLWVRKDMTVDLINGGSWNGRRKMYSRLLTTVSWQIARVFGKYTSCCQQSSLRPQWAIKDEVHKSPAQCRVWAHNFYFLAVGRRLCDTKSRCRYTVRKKKISQ